MTQYLVADVFGTPDPYGIYAPLVSPAFLGAPTAPTPLTADDSTAIATTAFVKAQPQGGGGAPLDSPAFTGTPTAPTPPQSNAGVPESSTRLATTAWVNTFVAAFAYAPLASPAFTGTPAAPTPLTADNSTKLATTAFVKAQAYAPLASPAFTGTPTAPTPPQSNAGVPESSTRLATTAWVNTFVAAFAYAPLASPAFTGTPTAPTPLTADNSTTVATTAFVKAQAYAPLASPTFTGTPAAPTPLTADNSTTVATTAFVKAQAYAPLASPTFTGTPAAPTPLTADNSTKLATTAFVKAQGYLASLLSTAPANYIGYAAGAGGAVTQLTSRATAVTINKPTGQITTFNSMIGSSVAATFTVNNSTVAIGDTILINCQNDTTSSLVLPPFACKVQNGSFTLVYANNSAAGVTTAFVFNFVVIKGAAS